MEPSAELAEVAAASPLGAKYGERIDRESAFERLRARVEQGPEPGPEKPGPVTKPRRGAKAPEPDSPTEAIVDFLGSRQGKALQRKLARGAFGLLRKRL
jgi:hypothetical protein